MSENNTNIIIAGLGGQGVLTSASILAYTVFLAGYDVKQSEIHGMSQRGGSLSSDIRFGKKIFSPMISKGRADFILLLSDCEKERFIPFLNKKTGVFLSASEIDVRKLSTTSALNTALLGRLSKELSIEKDFWKEAIINYAPNGLVEENLESFEFGTTL